MPMGGVALVAQGYRAGFVAAQIVGIAGICESVWPLLAGNRQSYSR